MKQRKLVTQVTEELQCKLETVRLTKIKQEATDLPTPKLEHQERRQLLEARVWGHLTEARTTTKESCYLRQSERNMVASSFLSPFNLPHPFRSQGSGVCRGLPSCNTGQARG